VRGGDVARRGGIVAEGDAQFADHPRQRRVGDDGSDPDGLEQLGLGDQPARPAQQFDEQRERLVRHGDGRAVAQKSVLGGIDLERSESTALNVGHERND
jgi:hypothetical protein